MNAVKATWTNGQILPAEPINWPEGSELVVEPLELAGQKVGLDEAEWRDDPSSFADWDAWLRTVEPLVLTEEERAEFEAYEERSRSYNLEAVRRQMAAEDAP